MSKHRVLSFKPQLRLEWRGQDGQDETQKPYHSASLGDSVTSSTRIEFSVHTTIFLFEIRSALLETITIEDVGLNAERCRRMFIFCHVSDTWRHGLFLDQAMLTCPFHPPSNRCDFGKVQELSKLQGRPRDGHWQS